MAFRPKHNSSGLTRLLSVQFLNFPFSWLSVILSTVMRAECETRGQFWHFRSRTELQECLGWDWVVKLPGASPSRGPAESGYQISLKNIPDLHYGLWTRHIKMFMRSLAMSSIQPLGHKLPKALNLIHKDIGQLLNNPRYFISIVMTTSM